MSLMNQGAVQYELNQTCRDVTAHVIFGTVGFIAKLAALVPNPRVNHTPSNGAFALYSKRGALFTNTRYQAIKRS